MSRTSLTAVVVAGAALTLPLTALGQQRVYLDRTVAAGSLRVFPSIDEETEFFYIPALPRLARDDNGNPQFSFLQYLTNVEGGERARGGGIVHFLVTLEVTPDELRDAERELRRQVPGATIVGPVTFSSGTFGLVSSFTDPEGELTRRVVGLGSAPILDNARAAVSVHLTELGAQTLWQSFQTATPDLSVTMEMDVDGYQSPVDAAITADWDQVYRHEEFAAALATPILAGEIQTAFDELREQGAIQITQVGDDEDMNNLIQTAYQVIMDQMFQPVGGTGTPDLAAMAGSSGSQGGLMDRATGMLATSRTDARQQNERIREENRRADEREEALARERAARQARERESGEGATEGEGGGESGEGGEGASAERPGRYSEQQPPERTAHTDAVEESTPAGGGSGSSDRRQEVAEPSFAIVATYQLKEVRRSGQFSVRLNKSTAISRTYRVDGNVGGLEGLVDDDRYFRRVNVDDPMYQQREVVAFLDGLNADDFGEFVNFVTVQMRKRHENGEETYDEVRIDRDNFNAEGNRFALQYGWRGDDDRSRWLGYDYRTEWSFFGGRAVIEPWRSSLAGAINLAPPYRAQDITLDADAETIAAAGVRAVTVQFFYDVEGEERSEQITMNVSRDELSRTVELVLPAGDPEYDYEITWRLRGDRTLSSGRRTTVETLLFVDELPGE